MDPFWCITLSVLAISKFWKHERRKKKERQYIKSKYEKEIEKAKQAEVAERFAAVLQPEPLTLEEREAERLQKEIEKKREKDIAELRKQGFTDELITTILPTINNGQ